MNRLASGRASGSLLLGLVAAVFLFKVPLGWSQSSDYQFNDSHFHLTDNI
jgi:hypothetical protein